MTETPRLKRAGTALIGFYTFGWLGALVVLGLAIGLLVVVDLLIQSQGDAGAILSWAQSATSGGGPTLPTWIMAVALLLQAPAMVLLIPFAWAVVDRRTYQPLTGATGRTEGWKGVLALRGTTPLFLGLGVVGGLTVGLLPGWYAHQMTQLFPSLSNGSLGVINDALVSGPIFWRALLALEIAVIVPVAEELVFRGFMWDALSRRTSPTGTWLLTSVIFCAYHMDPLQSSAIIPTALLLGWLRWRSGSLWPAVLLHVFNNTLGVAAGLLADGDVEPTAGLAVGGAGLTALWMVLAYRARVGTDPSVKGTPLA